MMVSKRIKVLVFSLATLAGLGTGAAAVRAAAKAKAEKKVQPSTFKLLHTLNGHAKTLGGGMSFSPDGKLLVSAPDTRLCLWDVATGKLIREVDPKAGWVLWPHFVLGGRCVICCLDDYPGDIQRFDVPSLKPRARDQVEPPPVRNRDLHNLTASPDGSYLAYTAGYDFGIWDLTNSKRLLLMHVSPVRKGEGEGARSLSFDPRGKRIAVALQDAAVKIYAVRDGKVLRQFVDPSISFVPIGGLAFSPDGQYLAVGMHRESLIRIWDINSGESRQAIRGWGKPKPDPRNPDVNWYKEQGVRGLTFSPDGKVVAVLCCDEKVRIWEVATGSLRCEVPLKPPINDSSPNRKSAKRDTAGYYQIVFAPDGKTLAANKDGEIQIWDWWNPGFSQSNTSAVQSRKHWKVLAGEDGAAAFRAMVLLSQAPRETIAFLAKHMRGAPSIAARRMDQLFADLDADDFTIRDKATQELAAKGIAIQGKLRQLLKRSSSPEVRGRVRHLLKRLPADGGPEYVRWLRAVEVLEHIGTRDAEAVLSRIARGTPGLTQTEEARAALERLSRRHRPQR